MCRFWFSWETLLPPPAEPVREPKLYTGLGVDLIKGHADEGFRCQCGSELLLTVL